MKANITKIQKILLNVMMKMEIILISTILNPRKVEKVETNPTSRRQGTVNLKIINLTKNMMTTKEDMIKTLTGLTLTEPNQEIVGTMM